MSGPSYAPASSGEDTAVVPQSKLCTLILIGLVLLVVLAWMLTWDPVIDARIRNLMYGRRNAVVSHDALMRNDPPLGVPLGGTAVGRTIKSTAGKAEGYLVVYVGSCSACMRVHLDEWNRTARSRGLRLVLFTTASRTVAKQFIREARIPTVPIVADEEGQLVRTLNASFTPRAYLFSPEWRLAWLQREPFATYYDPFTAPGFPHSIQGEQNDTTPRL